MLQGMYYERLRIGIGVLKPICVGGNEVLRQ
jgi:hypothetical protein